jgi:hypothetical protein
MNMKSIIGDVFLGHDLTTKIMRCRRVKLLLKDGRIRTLPKIFHIIDLDKFLIYVSKMSDIGVHIVFEKDT